MVSTVVITKKLVNCELNRSHEMTLSFGLNFYGVSRALKSFQFKYLFIITSLNFKR
jgi:hypothetical protein